MSELTRWPDATWAPLVRGQRVTVTHGEWSGEFRVTGIALGSNGAETYTLEPAANVDEREAPAEYCNVCENCPCLGNHPADEDLG
jgi:hypothetical protein